MPICKFERLDDPDLSGFFPQNALLDDCDLWRCEFFPVFSWLTDERPNREDERRLVREYQQKETIYQQKVTLRRQRELEQHKEQLKEDRERRRRRKIANKTLRAKVRRQKLEKKMAETQKSFAIAPDRSLTVINRSKGGQIQAALKRIGYVRTSLGRFEHPDFRAPIRSICFFEHTRDLDKMWIEVWFVRR